MIALWMLYALLVGGLAGLAASAIERLLRLWRLPVRLAWGAAMTVTVLAPVAAWRWSGPSGTVAVGPVVPVAAAPAPLPATAIDAPWWRETAAWLSHYVAEAAMEAVPRLTPLDAPLLALCAALSALMLLALARSALQLRRRRRGWRRQVVDGVEVLVAPDTGPAVVGGGPARVVLPAWALTLDASLRRLVLRHETEHLRAGDPHLLLAGVVALAAAPWNPALWWQLRRLRLAVELDCDRRVLRAHGDVERYGLLLMAVGQRAGGLLRLATPALSEPTTDLERRITAMTARPPRRRLPLALALAAAATLGAAGACVVPSPNTVAGPGGANARRDAAPSPAPQRTNPGQTFFEFQVEEPAAYRSGPAPTYPATLKAQGIGGQVVAQFVVDTLGAPDVSTFKAIESDHELFTDAVRNAVTQMRFTPARVGGRPVKQLVQQAFVFGQQKSPDAPPADSAGAARARVMAPSRAEPGARRATPPDSGFFEFTIDRMATLLTPAEPPYPAELRGRGVSGSVLAMFVVDTTGIPDVGSFKVVRSDHELFTAAVRAMLPDLRFRPAGVKGRVVRQLVQQEFRFEAR